MSILRRSSSLKSSDEPETLVSIDTLKRQIAKGEEINLHNNVPTLTTMKKMNKIVEDFILKHERIIYGGTAIDALLKIKGVMLRDADKLIDYDFYSPQYEYDTISIANELYAEGYKYVRRLSAIHMYTFRVGAEFAKDFLADVTYLPSKVYKKIPKVKINEMYYIDPQFAKIDLYKSVTNPHTNINRWIKSYKRLVSMENVYPISKNKLKVMYLSDTINPKIQDCIIRVSKKSDTIVATGIYAYKLYVSLIPGFNDKGIRIPEYEFYAIDPLEEAEKIISALKRNKVKNVEYKCFYPYMEIFPSKVVIYLDGISICSIYLIGENCIGVNIINRTKLVNYHVLLMFLYGKYNVNGIIQSSKHDKELYAWLIQSLRSAFDEYNKMKGFNGLEKENPFRIFQADCLTYSIEEAKLAAYKRNYYGVRGFPLYKPEKVRIDPSKLNEIYLGNFLGEEINEVKVKRNYSLIENQYKEIGLLTMKKNKKVLSTAK